jgi:HEPN domain-containing protein
VTWPTTCCGSRTTISSQRALAAAEQVSDAIVGFHAQQAVEKALKSMLALRAVEFPFTHDLRGLAELCADSGFPLPEALERIDELTPYGVRFRYGPIEDEALLDPAAALRLADGAVAWARAKIAAAR